MKFEYFEADPVFAMTIRPYVIKIMKYAIWGQQKYNNELIQSFLTTALRDIIELKTKIYHTVWMGNMWHCNFLLLQLGIFDFNCPI